MKAIDKARELKEKARKEISFARKALFEGSCAYYEKAITKLQAQRKRDRDKVVEAINKRIEMAKVIIKEDSELVKAMPTNDMERKDLNREINVNLNIVADYELLLKAIDKIYKEGE